MQLIGLFFVGDTCAYVCLDRLSLQKRQEIKFLTLNGTWAQVTIEGIGFHTNRVIQFCFLPKSTKVF